MKIKTTQLKHYRITAITFVVLTLGFLFYFFFYVKSNESYLNERAFRILSQIDENLGVKYATTLINARREAGYLTGLLADTIPSGKATAHATLSDKRGVFNKSLRFRSIKPIPLASVQVSMKRARLLEITSGWLMSIKDTADLRSELSSAPLKKLKKINLDSTIIYFEASTRLAEFVSPLLSPSIPEVFDEFVLFYDTNTLSKTDTSARKGPASYKVVYETFTSGFFHHQINDSLLNRAQPIIISGIAYKVFVQPVSMGKIQGLVLCGLIKSKRYQAQVFAVPMFTVIVMLILLMLLALGYPFFKLLIMSEWERVRASDAFFTVCSMIVGSFLITLLLFAMYEQYFPDKQIKRDDLESLSKSISASLVAELKAIGLQLHAYKHLAKQDTPIRSNTTARSNTAIRSYTTILSQKKDTANTLYPAYYPYLKDAFWIDSAGYSREIWTIEDKTSPSVYVGDREYFKKIIYDRAWSLPLSDTSWIAVGFMPIFDRITGKNLAVISTAYRNTHISASSQLPVTYAGLAIETELYSVVDPILPLGYGFCILDDRGTPWFHSDKRKNLQEKFVKETKDNSLLQSALLGNSNTHLELTYNGKEYEAYVSQIQHLPLHLVVFYNKDYSKTTSVLTITLSFLCYLICLLPLCVLLMAQKFSYVSDFRLRGENSPFAWLRPNRKKASAYRRLSGILISMLGLVLVYFFYPYQAILVEKTNQYTNGLPFVSTALTLHALTAIYSFLAAHLLLYDQVHLKTFRSFSRKINYRFFVSFLLLVALLNLYVWLKNVSSEFWLLVFFQLLLLAIILPWSLIKPSSLPIYITSKIPFSTLTKNYLAFLSLWVLLIGVLPAVSFFRETYNYEQQVAAKHYLMKMAQDLTKRKDNIEDTYREIAFANADDKVSFLHSLVFLQANFKQHSYHSTVAHHKKDKGVDKQKGAKSSIETDTHALPNEFTHQDDFAHRLRNEFLYNPVVVENQHLSFGTNSGSHQFSFSRDPQGSLSKLTCILRYAGFNQGNAEEEDLILKADLPHFWSSYVSHPTSLTVFLIIWGTLLYLLFSLCRFAVFRLFNLGIIDENYPLPTNFKLIADEILAEKKMYS
ncbi:hypothetical protein Q0590_36265 [Rhodocytophaga aerolata]|uniref:Cache domain-containing protein n=1 Tax=Rhodocytophaga aerolata TaxID=455078 RepID=A0ABT8RI49_9BACT|nr:hypothetical protein [Rhodocytophaga aerolata]MDO1451786.1 hypothetical protein [Rhodocytophaga aerolata]